MDGVIFIGNLYFILVVRDWYFISVNVRRLCIRGISFSLFFWWKHSINSDLPLNGNWNSKDVLKQYDGFLFIGILVCLAMKMDLVTGMVIGAFSLTSGFGIHFPFRSEKSLDTGNLQDWEITELELAKDAFKNGPERKNPYMIKKIDEELESRSTTNSHGDISTDKVDSASKE